jgi:hypothetical protein
MKRRWVPFVRCVLRVGRRDRFHGVTVQYVDPRFVGAVGLLEHVDEAEKFSPTGMAKNFIVQIVANRD